MQRDLPARAVPLLRLARPADADALRALHRQALWSLGSGHYALAQVLSFIKLAPTLDGALIADRSYFVAEVDGALVGSGGWSARTPDYAGCVDLAGPAARATPLARVRAMYTHPAWARLGIARRILRVTEAQARFAGHDELHLDALLPGVALYRACGYESIGRVVARLRDGATLDVLRMRKSLRPAALPPHSPTA